MVFFLSHRFVHRNNSLFDAVVVEYLLTWRCSPGTGSAGITNRLEQVLDADTLAKKGLSPCSFSIVSSRRPAIRRVIPGLPSAWFPMSSIGLQFAWATSETTWA